MTKTLYYVNTLGYDFLMTDDGETRSVLGNAYAHCPRDNDGNYIGHRHLSVPKVLSWRSFLHGMLVCHQAFYARTDIAKDIKYNLCYRHSADIDWCIRIMKVAEQKHLPLKNVFKVIACYQREGQTTKYHRASLLERFDIMKNHYGIFRTISSHLWFLIRAILRKLHINLRF